MDIKELLTTPLQDMDYTGIETVYAELCPADKNPHIAHTIDCWLHSRQTKDTLALYITRVVRQPYRVFYTVPVLEEVNSYFTTATIPQDILTASAGVAGKGEIDDMAIDYAAWLFSGIPESLYGLYTAEPHNILTALTYRAKEVYAEFMEANKTIQGILA